MPAAQETPKAESAAQETPLGNLLARARSLVRKVGNIASEVGNHLGSSGEKTSGDLADSSQGRKATTPAPLDGKPLPSCTMAMYSRTLQLGAVTAAAESTSSGSSTLDQNLPAWLVAAVEQWNSVSISSFPVYLPVSFVVPLHLFVYAHGSEHGTTFVSLGKKIQYFGILSVFCGNLALHCSAF